MKKFLAVLMAVAMMATMATFAMAAAPVWVTGQGYGHTNGNRVFGDLDNGEYIGPYVSFKQGFNDQTKFVDGAGGSVTFKVDDLSEIQHGSIFVWTIGMTQANGTDWLTDTCCTFVKNGDKLYWNNCGDIDVKKDNITLEGGKTYKLITKYVAKNGELASITTLTKEGTDVATYTITDFGSTVIDNGNVAVAKVGGVRYGWVRGLNFTKGLEITDVTYFASYDGAPTTGGTSPTENPANDPKTTEQVAGTIAALADPAKELPKEAERTTTAGGAAITVIPVQLTSGAAALDVATANLVGNGSKAVGLQASVDGGAMVVTMPGGFGAVTEPGRLYYPLDYSKDAPEAEAMLAAVKGADASSDTMKVGANMTMPTAVSVDVETNLADGAMANIYHYNPETGAYTFLGKHKVNAGRVAFMTKLMGQMLMTTGTI